MFLNRVGAIAKRFAALTQPADLERKQGLDYWRDLIYNRIIQILLVVGLFAILPNLWVGLQGEFGGLAIVNLLAYLSLLAFPFLRNAPYQLRALLFLTMGYSFAIAGFFVGRDAGSALLWLFCVPPVAGLLLNLGGGMFFWGLNTLFVVSTGLLLYAGIADVPGLSNFTLSSWGYYGINFVVTNLIVTVVIGLLLRGLTGSIERARKSDDLAQSGEARFRALFEGMLNGFAFHKVINDKAGQPVDYLFLEVNPAFEDLTGLKNVVGMTASEAIPGIWESNPELLETYGRVAQTGQPEYLEIFIAPLDSWFSVSAYSLEKGYFATIFDNITQAKQAEQEIEALSKFPTEDPNPVLRIRKDGRILFANEAGERMLQERDVATGSLLGERWRERVATVLNQGEPAEFEANVGKRTYLMFAAPIIDQGYVNVYAIDITRRLEAEKQLSMLSRAVESSGEVIFLTDTEGTITYVNSFFTQLYGYLAGEVIGKTTPRILKSGKQDDTTYKELWGELLHGRVFKGEFINRAKDGRLIPVSVSTSPVIDSAGKTIGFLSVQRDVSERKRAESQITQRLAELEAIARISAALRSAQSLDDMLPALLDTTLAVMNSERGTIWLYDESTDMLEFRAGRGIVDLEGHDYRPDSEKPGEGLAGAVYVSGRPYVSEEFRTDPNIPERLKQHIPPGVGGAAIPIHSDRKVLGVISITVPSQRKIEAPAVALLSTLADIAGSAIQRRTLYEARERDIEKLRALREIDRSILASPQLSSTLEIVTESIISRLNVDATTIMLFDEDTVQLRYAASQGFINDRFTREDTVALGAGFAGQVAENRRFMHISDLAERTEPLELMQTLEGEDMQSYLGVPLLAKGRMLGVLEIYHRAPMPIDGEWMSFLEALAGQVSIAIENATLFTRLLAANTQLRSAYDSTIEGWSHALDLRDHETEGHSQRVANLTLQLAHSLGIEGQELVPIRRGALLHDIGKMGIPDSILLKPDALTEEEWVVMRLHPEFSREMLSPIQYLQDSLEIPYRHHERWDGSGYPDGLQGEEIPLSARIFAVADVYDALTSNRPYRSAWPEEKAISYIQENSGILFDPQVVEAFLELVPAP